MPSWMQSEPVAPQPAPAPQPAAFVPRQSAATAPAFRPQQSSALGQTAATAPAFRPQRTPPNMSSASAVAQRQQQQMQQQQQQQRHGQQHQGGWQSARGSANPQMARHQ
eukprot:COSAG04_NODE_6233_length_1377_cov_1.309859_1_plen_108_part_10